MHETVKIVNQKNNVLYHVCMGIAVKINRWKYQHALKHGKLVELIAYEYKKNTGSELRNPPISYTEKMQFSKILDSTPEKGMLSDKYRVRDWVAEKIGEEYLIPLIGVWDRFDDIDFSSLPDSFVLKTNHASGTNRIVRDKSKIDLKNFKNCYDFWMKNDFAFMGRGFEIQYSYIEPKIIAEQYTVDSNGELNDFKFLCFNGKPYYCWVDCGRFSRHRRYVFDLEWNLQPWNQLYEPMKEIIDKPQNFEEMIELVTILCQGFAQVRVDLYNVDGKIYFGEMTFTNGKGYELIYPENYNDELGGLWKQDFTKLLKENK